MLAQAKLNSLELKVGGGTTHRFVLLLICEDDELPIVLPDVGSAEQLVVWVGPILSDGKTGLLQQSDNLTRWLET